MFLLVQSNPVDMETGGGGGAWKVSVGVLLSGYPECRRFFPPGTNQTVRDKKVFVKQGSAVLRTESLTDRNLGFLFYFSSLLLIKDKMFISQLFVISLQPNLPTCVRCLVCQEVNTEEQPLMECRFCGEIVHPSCLGDTKGRCKMVTEINNCWECPKCFKDSSVSVCYESYPLS